MFPKGKIITANYKHVFSVLPLHYFFKIKPNSMNSNPQGKGTLP